ncbi:MAG: tRNA preQ1(34) S-adenosylmethionine ribosyltransferase-isomerase QueA [Nannocystis sp.]|nr:tRNA preQ1(34) S-adenosylmethionine ribosyltransferase-isomerase QueA [Nannocystis sp.]
MGPEAFDYSLPPSQIAQEPAERRGDARMLVLVGPSPPTHARARALPEHLPRDALVVLNESRVVPARVLLRRDDEREFELLVCDPRPNCGIGSRYRAWVRGAKRLREGDRLSVDGFVCRFCGEDSIDPRARIFEIEAGELMEALSRVGQVPLPPYIPRPTAPSAADRERYQTLYARLPGSVAAPTAGLHWEPDVLARLDRVALTLHVGPGTFLPMEAKDVREHRVGAERICLDEAAATRIRLAQRQGRPIVAIGTTVTRALEAIAQRFGEIAPFEGTTDLVITPGHVFRAVDLLITNFHLPRSSLLMLVSAFGGHERVMAGYQTAVDAGYRFYSYGDCMLLDRG